MEMWLGKEQEGKYYGVYTLFVSGNKVQIKDINLIIKKHPAVNQIYFGAGLCSSYDIQVIRKCCKKYSDKIITVEIRFNELKKFNRFVLYKKNLNFVITFDDENKKLSKLNPFNVQIKLQCLKQPNRIILMSQLCDFQYVDISTFKEKIYHGDKKIK